MDIELVEKQNSQSEISKRAISQYEEFDEYDSKTIFWVCLLIKVLLIFKCCAISKKQCEKCLIEDKSETSLIFGNSSYLLYQSIQINNWDTNYFIDVSAYNCHQQTIQSFAWEVSVFLVLLINIEDIFYSVRKRLESFDVSMCNLLDCVVDWKQG
ncbi:unnamed protein product (macronuclear) [Paramecium tetraurelia]|uniref:Uncharacterized protein n=1 Tax=Paramecium tetraurelia TaxID=5888 RepID=A0CG85_PARTE|nr:uncharacterized protein GSPATT00038247001 [Paramecium tetraurelia]CAK69802.1 unnamed protein product [Paramecium tetraurelia]|eukprot:XP_001437199.1 hypothetical protein (macronuclear) [Paramecium tetraurelia strain d4-2]